MRSVGFAAGFLALGLVLIGPNAAHAQGWVSFVSMEDRFAQWFPAEPTVEEVEWIDEDGSVRPPARKYSAERGNSTYALYAVDYSEANFTTMRGSMAHTATKYRQLGDVTYDAYAQLDRIEGHQLQITLEEGRRIFFATFLHDNILYVLDANIPPRVAPPLQFQQSMQILDAQGIRVRYTQEGERILRTDDLAEGLGGAEIEGCILEGTSDE
ncbi:MAG: hypothetical protein GTO41_25570, partial [Burkholderiales bacterium]|nr:hypothetical protein [Burkholderiales bacterium]